MHTASYQHMQSQQSHDTVLPNFSQRLCMTGIHDAPTRYTFKCFTGQQQLAFGYAHALTHCWICMR
jgi:hypothetical protein